MTHTRACIWVGTQFAVMSALRRLSHRQDGVHAQLLNLGCLGSYMRGEGLAQRRHLHHGCFCGTDLWRQLMSALYDGWRTSKGFHSILRTSSTKLLSSSAKAWLSASRAIR